MTYNAQLEIDSERGVIYVHLANEEDILKLQMQTPLRICGLKIDPLDEGAIDITIRNDQAWVTQTR